jgi:hypothetical protein
MSAEIEEVTASDVVMYALLAAMFVGEGHSMESALVRAKAAKSEPWFGRQEGSNLRPLAKKIVSLVRSATTYAGADSLREWAKKYETGDLHERASALFEMEFVLCQAERMEQDEG